MKTSPHRKQGSHFKFCIFCYLIVIAAVSLATFVAFLMVFLLETTLQEGIPLHKLEHSLVSGYFWGKNMCVWMGS